MTILLFGKNGQVGWQLQRSLAPLGEVVALGHDGEHGLCGDFSDPDGVAETIRKIAPEIIVNAAAFTAVDGAESAPELARTVNACTPGVLATEASKLDAWLVHYSTDYVFNGQGETPWLETDSPDPLSIYGKTKLEGERSVARCPKHLIFRTSWVYAARGNNFVKTMLRLAQERDHLKVIDDQIGAPTGADLIADVTAHALRHVRSLPALAGLYHLAASGETSWHGYAAYVIELARRQGMAIRLPSDAIEAIPTRAYATPACRPLNSRLDTRKLREAFGIHLPHWQPGVARMIEEIL